ncbi:hypothetical protein HPE56_01785 [Maribacter sp. ANRC-HE7]|uniref:Ig-like domain-containing protein n=1 Tax=Maribacter aquimaris TaxID=2737171 RepID=A0ABR7V010_9FLAO|nr:hypothetical protein [Maribacter aquimaris]MBD0776508.1 hypothetical protein [Maribacter aquimaris]
MQRIVLPISAFILIMVWSSCRNDFEYASNPGNLRFSKDTVFLDTVFSKISSSTYTLKVYNPNDDAIEVSSIRLKQGENSAYRLNVDGMAGKEFTNIPILAKDSLYIFIETTYSPTNDEKQFLYTDAIVFKGLSNTQEVQLVTLVKDAILRYPKILEDGTKETHPLNMDIDGNQNNVDGFFLKDDELIFTNDKPYVIYGYAIVPENQTLQVNAGARIYFHEGSGIYVSKGASLHINGTLSSSQDTLENEVIFEGDRLEPEYSNVPGQWGTIWMAEGSRNNSFNHVTIKNATFGAIVKGDGSLQSPTLTINNTQIYNSSITNLQATNAYIKATNTVLGGAGGHSLQCTLGGRYEFTHSTIANYWSHGSRMGTALKIDNYDSTTSGDLVLAQFYNCIIDGSAPIEISLYPNEVNTFNFVFDHSLIKFEDAAGLYTNNTLYDFNDNTKYIGVLINQNTDFKGFNRNVYQLGEASSAIDKADLAYSLSLPYDIIGTERTQNPDIGAYEYTPK